MLALTDNVRYFICCTLIDIRNGFNGLAGIVQNRIEQDPSSGDIFIFLSKSRTQIKLLYRDHNGYVVYHKRLDKGTFDLLKNGSESRELKREELAAILQGAKLSKT